MDKRAKRVLAAVLALILLAAAVLAVRVLLQKEGGRQLRQALFGAESFADWDGIAVFLGDSITDFCDLGYYYPGLNTVNAGISGDTTDWMLDRLETSVLRYEPDILVLLGGINDLLRGGDEEQIVANLMTIVDTVRERVPQVQVLVQSVYPIGEGDDLYWTGRIRAINSRLEALAGEHDYDYVNLFDALATEDGRLDERYSYDGLHPNDTGYAVVSSILTQALEKITGRGLLG